MKKKKIIVIVLIAIVLIVGSVVTAVLSLESKKNNSNKNPKTKVVEKINAIDKSNTSGLVTIKSKISEVQNMIDSINERTNDLNKSNIKMDSSMTECGEKRFALEYAKSAHVNTFQVSDSNYVSACVLRIIEDSCNGRLIKDKYDLFVYDINQKKMLSQDELYSIIKVDKNKLLEFIQKALDKDTSNKRKAEEIAEDINVFYIGDGIFAVMYFDKDKTVYEVIPIQ